MSFRYAPYTESHDRNGSSRIERGDHRKHICWEVFVHWRHVATFFKRSWAREYIRDAKRKPVFS